LFQRLLDRTDYVGEVGLDHSQQGRNSSAREREVFERILALQDVGRVLTVHSRRAEKETVELLEQSGVTAILRWYSGPLGVLERALVAGLYFSVNPAMLGSANGRRILAALPRKRVVTETDAPYTKVGGRASERRDVPGVVAELARMWTLTAEEAKRLVPTASRCIDRRREAPRLFMQNGPLYGPFVTELAGLEPATSWVRSTIGGFCGRLSSPRKSTPYRNFLEARFLLAHRRTPLARMSGLHMGRTDRALRIDRQRKMLGISLQD
jgi:TatD related DNase